MTTGRPRPAATALFLGGGTLGVPGTPRLSEFIRGLHAPGKSFQEPPREIPLGRRQTRRNAVTPTGPRCTLSLAVSFIVGRGNLWGRICFFYHSFLLFFCSSSSRLKSVLNTCTHRRESGGPFDQPLRKVPQIPGISVAGALGNIIGLVRRHKARGTF